MNLRQRLAAPPIVAAPGIYDVLSALTAVQAGFECLFLAGSALSLTLLGRPDVGLLGASDVADMLARITDRVGVPVLVDADSGFGSAIHVAQTVRAFERAGAAAIQLEDQVVHKAPGALTARPVLPTAEMVGKIKAALDARQAALVSARTDAMSSLGFERALDRAHAYAEAGADLVFVESLTTLDQIAELRRALGVPLLHNLIEGGPSPLASAADAERAGFAMVLFPDVLVRGAAHALQLRAAALARQGRTGAADLDRAALQAMVAAPEFLAEAARYDARSWEAK